jgi:membrane protein
VNLDRIEHRPAFRFAKRFSSAEPSVLAAAVAYNLFFALVPAAAVVLLVASLFGKDVVATETALAAILPPDMAKQIAEVLNGVAQVLPSSTNWLIVIGIVIAGWSASRGVLTLIRVLRQIEELEEDRPWWKVRLVSILLTVGGAIVFALTMLLIPVGGVIADWLEATTGITWIHTVWSSLRIPIASIGVLVFLWLFYRFGPPRRLPGIVMASISSTAGIVGVSLAFQLFIDWQGGAPGATFAVFTLAVLLLWLYIIAYVIMLAATISSEIARRSRRR